MVYLQIGILILLVGSVLTIDQTYRYLIFTQQCYQQYFSHYQFLNWYCFKHTIIKTLSYGLVLGGLVLKLPQVIKILLHKSTFGISFLSITLEIAGSTFSIAYNLNRGNIFSIYGQNFFIGSMNILITILFIKYSRQNKLPYWLALISYASAIYIISHPEILPEQIYDKCIFIQMFLVISARMAQIIHIFKCQSTGNLALLSFLFAFAGNLARLLTIFVDADKDIKLKVSLIIATTLNGFILFQFYLFRNAKQNNQQKQKSQ